MYEFDEGTGDWSQVGNALPATDFVARPALTALTPTSVVYIDPARDKLHIYKFDEATGDWAQVGGTGTFGADVAARVLIAALTFNKIAIVDAGFDTLRTYLHRFRA